MEIQEAKKVMACIQICNNGHKYYAQSHEYPCKICECAKMDAALAALRAENERLKKYDGVDNRRIKRLEAEVEKRRTRAVELGFYYDSENGITDILVLGDDGEPDDREVIATGLMNMIRDNWNALAAAEAREGELREKVREWKMSNGGLRTEYIDWEELEQLLGGEK